MERPFDLIVIGGGASGLMAAGRAGERGLSVLLFEKNATLGEKLRISGGGRCNITNAEPDIHAFVRSYGSAGKYLYALFAQFGQKDTEVFFTKLGLPLKTEARNRMFPETERAEDVVSALQRYLAKGSVTILTDTPVTEVHADGGRVRSVTAGGRTYGAREFVFATGGVSHPETGSTGDGFAWLRALGHTVQKPTPTIVPLKTRERWSHELAGVAIHDMKITFYAEGRKAFSEKGTVLCTHFGISGPLILNVAHKVSDLMYTGAVTAKIDLYPDLDVGALDALVLGRFAQSKNKVLRNALRDIVPEGTLRGILMLLPTEMVETKVHSLSRENRGSLVRLLKALPITIEGLMGFDRSVVADGGVPVAEVDMRTTRSKKLSNVFILGDLLHIRRPSGGYSLQLAWSTGFVAGSHAGER
ncbi:aminoacetone oxidase family FAD-binding enzyme [Patescibacteria group bacterium]|nr:aminoacetone oxidase family FAD-binding enzyme [Patescibacteria group bacterium]